MTSLSKPPALAQLLRDSITIRHPEMQLLTQAICDALCAHHLVPSDPIAQTSAAMQEECQRAALLIVRYLDPRWRARAFTAAAQQIETHWRDTPGMRRAARFDVAAALWAFLHELDGQAPEQRGTDDE